ncbi:hypothetical protein M407DRAFT_225288 [Tulasnella calospora MUT 4182]|uniref:Uncharacterized protein n=1 Tax=Tulasnella calospora MUT 4182 TaxID=1051891 RepID=A0A0C3KAU3_9AGAM|nr:hypothetical protein M407DRAFT_225288 [Tulasnella calospora MUT 4182]
MFSEPSNHSSRRGRDVSRRIEDALARSFILVPKHADVPQGRARIENSMNKFDHLMLIALACVGDPRNATIARDPDSACYWVFTSSDKASAILNKGDTPIDDFEIHRVDLNRQENNAVTRMRAFLTQKLNPNHAISRRAPASSKITSNQATTELASLSNPSAASTLNQLEAHLDNDAYIEVMPPSPASSTSSESEIFYSARSSFIDDSATQPADVPAPPQHPTSQPSGEVDLISTPSISRGPLSKRARLDKLVSIHEKPTSPPTSLDSSNSDPPYGAKSSLVNNKDEASIQLHRFKSLSTGNLPPEAWEHILQLFLPVVPPVHKIEPGYTAQAIKSYYAHIYTLMNVCSGWKHAMEALFKVWTHIANVMPLSVLETYLARSKGEGVKIVFVAGTGEPGPVDEELCAFRTFMNKVVPHRSRWTSLAVVDFPASKGNHPLQAVFDVPAPSLKEVYVGTRNNAALSTWKPLSFSRGAPNLRTLCVHGATPDLGDYTFARQLGRLHIANPSWVNTIHLIGVLARNHTIRDLKLVNIKFAIGEERLKQDIDVFDLPNLESFTLSTLNTSAEFGQLFTRLQAPRCREYNISVDLDQLEGSRIESKAATTTIEWNLLGFGLDQFLGTLRDRIARDLVYPEGERQWFDWKEAQDTAPVFEWRSGCFADGVTEGHSFLIRFRTRDRGAVYEWVDLVQRRADELRAMRGRLSD